VPPSSLAAASVQCEEIRVGPDEREQPGVLQGGRAVTDASEIGTVVGEAQEVLHAGLSYRYDKVPTLLQRSYEVVASDAEEADGAAVAVGKGMVWRMYRSKAGLPVMGSRGATSGTSV
jgi:hypothetical protein